MRQSKQHNFLAGHKPFVYDDFDILKIGNLLQSAVLIFRVCRIYRHYQRERPHRFFDIIDAVDFSDLVETVERFETEVGKVDKVENILADQYIFIERKLNVMKDSIRKTLELMRKKGFITHEFDTASQAREFILSTIGSGRSVGFGGSVTTEQLGLYDALLAAGNKCFFHWKCAPENRAEVLESARKADFYIMSSNAVSEDGAILNIDGTGNRVGAFIYGPQTVFLVLGENKFSGTREEAFKRVKTIACPANARRLKLSTPCALTGKCANCSSPQRMCNYTVWTEAPRRACEVHVCAVAEPLGY